MTTGRALATLEGHSNSVLACAVTPDGRRVVSASADSTLKVWDLDTHACLFTHRGDSGYAAVAATATTIVAGDVRGTVWFLDWPSSSQQRSAQLADEPLPPAPPIKKHIILFLAANPSGTDRLALDEEARAIQVELERSGFRDCFELVTRWAVKPLDLLRELRRLKPTVVHFSGHGGHGGHGGPAVAGEHRPGPAPHRGIAGELRPHGSEQRHGLCFQGSDGRPQLVSAQALEQTFGAAGSSVRLVVLNACYSELQAEALLAHVDCVVGMNGAILDDAARSFAIGFYGGLAEHESIAAAYKQGRAAISLDGLPDSDRPQLKVRPGVDASQHVLAADPR
jgi:hypothetical protein